MMSLKQDRSIWRFKQLLYRSNRRRCSVTKDVYKNFAKFAGKHVCQSLFFNKVAGLRPSILLKKRLWHKCFPVNFAKFLRTLFLQNTSGRLLLIVVMKMIPKISILFLLIHLIHLVMLFLKTQTVILQLLTVSLTSRFKMGQLVL